LRKKTGGPRKGKPPCFLLCRSLRGFSLLSFLVRGLTPPAYALAPLRGSSLLSFLVRGLTPPTYVLAPPEGLIQTITGFSLPQGWLPGLCSGAPGGAGCPLILMVIGLMFILALFVWFKRLGPGLPQKRTGSRVRHPNASLRDPPGTPPPGMTTKSAGMTRRWAGMTQRRVTHNA